MKAIERTQVGAPAGPFANDWMTGMMLGFNHGFCMRNKIRDTKEHWLKMRGHGVNYVTHRDNEGNIVGTHETHYDIFEPIKFNT